ncbi:hypothetical protein BST99_04990 [Aureicoccus marinus]|uniref:Outer membrane protein beta-barrel domain-containing protein n=1 Tax=Aureicoccus marinus TaxID=754435 RepID=A0A2S7T5G3_9FLAO|nr:hypothetical protein BST99_04990 [Aureicoccus marinus]
MRWKSLLLFGLFIVQGMHSQNDNFSTTTKLKSEPYFIVDEEPFQDEINRAFRSVLTSPDLAKLNFSPECNLKTSYVKQVIDHLRNTASSINFYPTENFQKKPENVSDWTIEGIFKHLELKSVDRGFFPSVADRVAQAYSDAKNFSDFAFRLTKKDLGKLSDEQKNEMRVAYNKLSFLLKKENHWRYRGMAKTIGECRVFLDPTIRVSKLKFPKVDYEVLININSTCPCGTGVKESKFTYTAKLQGIMTNSKWSISTPKKVKFNTEYIKCCPSKENAKQASYDELSDRIAESMTQRMQESLEESPNREEFKEPELADRPIGQRLNYFAGGGLVLGPETDFFGFNYLVSIAYLIHATKALEIMPELGYSRFTGKETDFGFQTEGVAFAPVKARALVELSDVSPGLDGFTVSAGLGYAIGLTEGISGGMAYDIGGGYRIKNATEKSPCQWDLSAMFTGIQVENGSFSSVIFGVRVRY